MEKDLRIYRATNDNIEIIEDILYDVTDYYESIGDPQWLKKDIRWSALSKIFKIEDFYILEINCVPVGCMAILDHDPVFWPEVPKGASLYIHKLAVKREYKGKGYGRLMVNYVKDIAINNGIKSVRVDFHKRKRQLRAFYENLGFTFVREDFLFGDYESLFFVWSEDNTNNTKGKI